MPPGCQRQTDVWNARTSGHIADVTGFLSHPEGVEPTTSGFVVRRSIQLSYGCVGRRSQHDELVESTRGGTQLPDFGLGALQGFDPRPKLSEGFLGRMGIRP